MAQIQGRITVNEVEVLEVDGDPSSGLGTSAPTGSLAMADVSGLWQKTGSLDTNWEQFQAVVGSASPGFTWGRSGTTPPGSYLQNDTVPSNISGRLVPVSGGYIRTVFVALKNAASCTVVIQKRVGAVFTDLATVTLTSQRIKIENLPTTVSVAFGDEIAVKIGSGSASDPVVGLVIKGTL